MSVYIKGMEMPHIYYECQFNRNGFCDFIQETEDRICLVDQERNEQRNDNCPLVPVPEHGRLIDADAIVQDLSPTEDDDVDNKTKLLLSVFFRVLKAAPTILPADKEAAE